MKPLPRIPFPIALAGLTVATVLYACGQGRPGFGNGGDPLDDSKLPDPTDDTGDTGADDTAMDDTAVEDSAVEDTAPPVDTSPPFLGEGYDRGDVAYNLVAPDQFGTDWRLYDFSGDPTVLVFGYAQGPTFQDICSWLPEIQAEYASYGLDIAVVLFLDEMGLNADQADASAWANTYDLGTVLYDPDEEIRNVWASTQQVKTYLIDGEMVIRWTNLESTSREQLRQAIGDLVY
jgi:hypothetical protein